MAENIGVSFACRRAPMYQIVTLFYWVYHAWWCFRRGLFSRFQSLNLRDFVDGPLIIVANHPADSDPLLINVHLRSSAWFTTVHWLAKFELADPVWLRRKFIPTWPRRIAVPLARFAAWVVRSYGIIPVDRQSPLSADNLQSLRVAEEILKAGGIVGIFSEGGTNPSLSLEGRKVSSLAVKLGSRLRVPVMPVCVTRKRMVLFGESFVPRTNLGNGDAAADAQKLMKEILEHAA